MPGPWRPAFRPSPDRALAMINTRLLSHPFNWVVIGAIALFWAVAFDIVARHYGSLNPGRLAAQ